MTEPTPIYSGEAILLSWGESNRDGRVVRFKIEEDGTHPFKGLETGVNGGQRFMLVAVPIQNDGAPVRPVSAGENNGDRNTELAGGHANGGSSIVLEDGRLPAKPKTWADMKPSAQAGTLCGDDDFLEFLSETHPQEFESYRSNPAEFVRQYCGVSTRAHLDLDNRHHDRNALRLWEKLCARYRTWQREQAQMS